ncbi:MAG: hypothetical protein E6713_03020 [Sporomusaceae bacterium]|nr:hypothetical protein [Sporomusaceae bacterium]
MGFDTKKQVTDQGGLPIAQMYNPVLDDYEPMHGADNCANFLSRTDAMTCAPVNNVKTVTTAAAPIFAGDTALDGRYKMLVYNAGTDTIYWGGSPAVTVDNGMPVFAGDYGVFDFYPTITTQIYFVAAANQSVRVVEVK